MRYTREKTYFLPVGTKIIRVVEGKYPILTTITLNKPWEQKAETLKEAEIKLKEHLKVTFKCDFVEIPNLHKHLKVKEEIPINPKDYRPLAFRQWADNL